MKKELELSKQELNALESMRQTRERIDACKNEITAVLEKYNMEMRIVAKQEVHISVKAN